MVSDEQRKKEKFIEDISFRAMYVWDEVLRKSEIAEKNLKVMRGILIRVFLSVSPSLVNDDGIPSQSVLDDHHHDGFKRSLTLKCETVDDMFGGKA